MFAHRAYYPIIFFKKNTSNLREKKRTFRKALKLSPGLSAILIHYRTLLYNERRTYGTIVPKAANINEIVQLSRPTSVQLFTDSRVIWKRGNDKQSRKKLSPFARDGARGEGRRAAITAHSNVYIYETGRESSPIVRSWLNSTRGQNYAALIDGWVAEANQSHGQLS